jgi:hypothetical protein
MQKDGGIAYPEGFVRARHPPLKFAITYSGFKAPNEAYSAFYEPQIRTPMMHFIGSLDTVVEEAISLKLVDACENSKVVYHPGGHFLPSGKPYLMALEAFIREKCSGKEDQLNETAEKSAENMDVPF